MEKDRSHTEESFIIGNLTGMAAAIAKDIYGYYFGSSKGERDAGRNVKSAFRLDDRIRKLNVALRRQEERLLKFQRDLSV